MNTKIKIDTTCTPEALEARARRAAKSVEWSVKKAKGKLSVVDVNGDVPHMLSFCKELTTSDVLKQAKRQKRLDEAKANLAGYSEDDLLESVAWHDGRAGEAAQRGCAMNPYSKLPNVTSAHVSDDAMDARARRAAKRVGLVALKTRWRSDSVDNYGGFQLVDPNMNTVEAGEKFDLTALEVIDLCRARVA